MCFSVTASDANEPSLSWLPRDIIWNCLLRVQRSDHLSVSRVSKSLKSLVCSPEFRCLFPKDSLYVSFVAPGMASNWLWFTLRRLPTKKNEYQLVHVPIPVPFPRHPWLSPPKTVVAGSKIYFIGGPYHLSNDTDLWIFDTRSGKLTQGPSMKVARRRGGYLVGVIEGKIYVIGGGEVNEEVQVEVFDPKTRSWDFAGEEKECNPSSTFTVSMDQKVYMVGSTADVSAYNPNPSRGRRVELIRKVQNRNKTYEEFVDRMECVCEVENVMYACFDWCGLKWFDTMLKVWKKLVRRDGKPLYANPVSAMSEYNGMLAVLWKRRNFGFENKEDVICGLISLFKVGEGICGEIEWSGIVDANPNSRDAYGFALRPQHVQRYQEYLSIYTEEETERGEKWKNFLDRLDDSAEHASSEEEFQDTFQADGSDSDSDKGSRNGKNDSDDFQESDLGGKEVDNLEQDSSENGSRNGKNDSDYLPECELSGKEVEHLEQDSSETDDELSKESEPAEEAQVHEEHQSGREKSHGKDEEEEFESEKEKDFTVESESESDEEKQSQSVKETVDNLHIQQENATEKLVAEEDKCGLEHDQEKKETKNRSVIKWAHIRPCLSSLEAMMCTRVKKGKYMNNKQSALVADHASLINKSLSSIGEAEQDSGENDRDSETSTGRCDSIKEENDAHSSVSPEPFFPWFEELEVLVRLGVPKDLRGEVWQAFVGVKARRVERYYQDLLAQITNTDESAEQPNSSDVQRKWKKQIEKDIPRTFPGHPALNENGRDSLRRILLAYACHNPSVGYCQAMNFFAGLLLLLMPEENAFWTLVGIIDDYFDGYYTEEMIESQVDQLVFEELMRERFPKLVNHLDYLGVQVAWISGPWFLSIFVNILPWECVLRMWDVLLFEGNRVVLFRTAFAIMELYGPAIVATQDAGDAITSLQTLASSTFDSSQLVLTACMGYLSTNEARLEELREVHRPAVLEIVEERIHKGRVWKDNKGLASKLYSFKHEGSILDEQKPDADESHSLNPDGANVDSELDSLPDLQEQVVWMKVELCRLLEEKRSAVLRAEELEIALMEMVKEDNRLELSAQVESLENEVRELKQVLSDKKEQEAAMLQVLMRVEQDQRLTEDARVSAEQDAAAQRYAVHVLQEKNEKLATQLAQMEKRVVTAETTLEATLQYESGQNKALSSPRFARTQASPQETLKKKTGFLSFGLGWRERNKAKPEESNGDNTSNATSEVKSPSKETAATQGSNVSKDSKSEDLLNPETRR
ncbi:hypothetical protein AALP_AA4G146900 [Arabis alpina]|uniref:Rab-GAP TBC domain-containing protein n=1 Tax=Arabis alpina TaxID=50452 RepID=A0A087H3B4_ARAAL|nr:hypothetical protein AALP_AA4G146900 [Arabis alpina]